MAPVPASVAKQAERLKLDGNTYYNKGRFGAAIDAYTEAITLCPDVVAYRTNRALCHLKRNEWTKVEEDCRRAIELDSSFFKAHYMLGHALLQRQEYAEGIRELEKALDLGRGAHMIEEIWQVLAQAKYKEWERSSSERAWRLQNLKDACERALTERLFLDDTQSEDGSKKAANDHVEQLEFLEEVFTEVAVTDTPTAIPDYLCCKITLDIFRDPVVAPSGITFERVAILEHLQKVGKFDPITREPLQQSQLVPNFAIKEAVQAYLDKHGWAYRLDD